MPAFTNIPLKLDGMRKTQSFLLYPYNGGDTIQLQSDTRIMRLNLRDGSAILSRSHPNGSYGPDLMPERGAYKVQISPDDLKTIQSYLWNHSGEQSFAPNGTKVLTIENKELFSKEA